MTAAVDETLNFAIRLKGRCGERPPGSNHNFITEWYGFDGPWCDMGVSYCFYKTDQEEEGKHAYTPEHFASFVERKRAFRDDAKAKRGDLAFMDFPDSLPRIQHVAFLLRPLGNNMFQTMEFNTSSGDSGSQDDGGNAYIRTRSGIYIVGWGRPDYNGNVDKPDFDFPDAKQWFGPGDQGADVKLWQKDLNQWRKDLKDPPFDFVLDITKKFDDRTLRATKTFQTYYKLDVDGRVGKHTIRKMEQVRKRQERRDK